MARIAIQGSARSQRIRRRRYVCNINSHCEMPYLAIERMRAYQPICMRSSIYQECCARSRYQRRRQVITRWRHQMETFSALLALCAGNSPVPVNSPHKGQWLGALMFSLICARINDWVNNREAGDLRRHRGHYDVSVMTCHSTWDVITCPCPSF